MRTAFIRTLEEQAKLDKNIWLLCGDVGYSVLENFARQFPERFLNVGVAEQNMIGIAAGLALSGKRVFTYTIGNFAFMRAMEQIRNDVCLHNLNVTIVAVGGGYAYGPAGYTHHALEDIAMMRALPNLTLLAPGDPVETTLATQALATHNGPAYLRLGRGGETIAHTTPPAFAIGKAIRMQEGALATIITSTATLGIAHDAATRLKAQGMDVALISMPTLIPFDHDAVLHAAKHTPRIITVEEHGSGGLASLVSETIARAGIATKLRTHYAHLPPCAKAGDQKELRAQNDLTADAIIASVKS